MACFNAIDVVSRYPTGNAYEQRRSQAAATFLIQVWQAIGIPHYTQVDNEGCFNGGATHPYVLGRVVRLALQVGTELLFSPVYHPRSIIPRAIVMLSVSIKITIYMCGKTPTSATSNRCASNPRPSTGAIARAPIRPPYRNARLHKSMLKSPLEPWTPSSSCRLPSSRSTPDAFTFYAASVTPRPFPCSMWTGLCHSLRLAKYAFQDLSTMRKTC